MKKINLTPFCWFIIFTVVSLTHTHQEIWAAPEAQGKRTKNVTETAKPVTASDQPRIKSERFDDWFYRCVEAETKAGKANKRCEVVQIAQTQHDGNLINLLTISFSEIPPAKKKKAKQTVITVLAPQNVYLPDGMKIGVDKYKKLILQFRNCNNAGCWTQHLLNKKHIRRFERGKLGFGHMKMINGQKINIKFSLKGLKAALAALKNGKEPQTGS